MKPIPKIFPNPLKRNYQLTSIAILGILTLWLILTRGRWEEDESKHFLIARYAWTDWRLLLDVWGRPGYTIPASLFAMMGHYRWVQIFSALAVYLCCMGALRGGRILNMPLPSLAAVIMIAQPIVLRVGTGAYTEPVFAACLVWGLVFWMEKRFFLSAFLFGWLALTRLEGTLMLPLFIILLAHSCSRCLLRAPSPELWSVGDRSGCEGRTIASATERRVFLPILILFLPLLLWAGLAALFSGNPFWLAHAVPYRLQQYGELGGYPGYYMRELIELLGPVLFSLAIIGGISLLHYSKGWAWVITAIYYYLIQEMSFTFAYGSAGYARFLAGMSPILSVMALAGLVEIIGMCQRCQRLRRRALQLGFILIVAIAIYIAPGFRKRALASAAGFIVGTSIVLLIPMSKGANASDANDNSRSKMKDAEISLSSVAYLILILSIFTYTALRARPVRMQPLDRSCQDLAKVARKKLQKATWRPRLCSSLYQFYERVGVNPFDPSQAPSYFDKNNIQAAENGILILWDDFFGTNLYHVSPEIFQDVRRFELIAVSRHVNRPELRLYRKLDKIEEQK
jgi:hypothetical protein